MLALLALLARNRSSRYWNWSRDLLCLIWRMSAIGYKMLHGHEPETGKVWVEPA